MTSLNDVNTKTNHIKKEDLDVLDIIANAFNALSDIEGIPYKVGYQLIEIARLFIEDNEQLYNKVILYLGKYSSVEYGYHDEFFGREFKKDLPRFLSEIRSGHL
ncbi:hypothetical protein EGI26_14325 [Lacihabitans sp. CCS-44]|uniref:hypothetical protein n=1 Tax=Lacihabitans sp. CCS-44 TaxID=2487331 RepID=UPI0020CF0685|nr:hypothetical protein [Lacihabitans sp. CCS-44]MCP9756337.1 hypothetical protein [Lacihabitans sp. CCS-44]